MAAAVRSEIVVEAPLAEIYLWMTESRRRDIALVGSLRPPRPFTGQLRLGMPVIAPRAVLCPVQVFEDGRAVTPVVSGRLRAVVDPRLGAVSLTFDGAAYGAAGGRLLAGPREALSDAPLLIEKVLDLIAMALEPALAVDRLTA